MKDWESYENEKSRLQAYIKKAEDELERPVEFLNQDIALRDLEAKKV